ncbi:signal peptide peptidase SppA [Fibrobacterota bacterium]
MISIIKKTSHSAGTILLCFLTSLHSLESPFISDTPSPLSLSSCVFGNPAGISPRSGKFTSLGFALEDNDSFSSFRFGHQGRYTGIGYQYADSGDQSQFALAASMPVGKNLNLGFAMNYSVGDLPSNWTTDLGIQVSPFSSIRIGYYTHGLLQSDETVRGGQVLSAGVRPLAFSPALTARFTVAYEVRTHGFDDQAWEKSTHSVFTDLQLFKWLHVQGRRQINNGENISVAGILQLSPTGLFGYNHVARDGGSSYGEYVSQVHYKTKKDFLAVPGKVVVFDLDKTIVEGSVKHPWFGREIKIGHLQIMSRLSQIENTPGLKVMLLKIGDVHCDWAIAADIRNTLLRLRKGGVRIVSYLETTSRLNYYLASAASEIVMPPSSYFDVRGYASEVSMYKGLLDKIGVEAQFIRHGDYKSFPEIFTREEMSDQWRSNLQSYLYSLWDVFLHSVSASRGIPRDSLEKIFTKADLSLSHARATGLIDTALYQDQVMEYAYKKGAMLYKPPYQGQFDEDWSQGKDIALITLEGAITLGKSHPGGFFSAPSSGSETICSQLRKARLRNSVKAVVIRINSPGGSAIASDIIYRELDLLRKKGKPVIVSVGGACASGGYFVASGGDLIVAEENSIVGSIGIFGGKFILKGLYDKVGIKKEVIATHPHADALSDYRKWDAEEQEAIQEYMDDFYQRFTDVVIKSRKFSPDSLDSLAGGRIFTGKQALTNGLVDLKGGLEDAVEAARERMGAKPGGKVRLVRMGETEISFPGSAFHSQSHSAQSLKEDYQAVIKQFTHTQVWALSLEAMALMSPRFPD